MPENTTTEQNTIRTPRWFWLVFFALTVFVYFFGLSIPLLGPDEPRYAEVAREMFLRHDWITPTLGGSNWFEKPALLYWLEIVSYHIFGVNEFAARFGPALCGLGTIFSVWLICRKATSNSDFANWSTLAAASTIGVIVFSRGASFDIVVTFPLTAAMAGFIVYRAYDERRLMPLVCFYFFIGIALLAKGLIGLIFPIGIVSLYYVFVWRLPKTKFLLSLVWGLPIIFVVAATWYLPMYLRHGETFIDEFVIQQHFQRFLSNKYQHPQPFIFFFWVLPLMTIPWLPFFLISIWRAFRGLVKRFATHHNGADETSEEDEQSARDDRPHLSSFLEICYAWMLVPLLFFSLSGSKLPGYILPSLVPAIILSALEIYRYVRQSSNIRRLVLTTAVATYVVVIASLIFVVPRFARHETVKGLITAANAKGFSDLPVVGFIVISHNAEFYAAGRLLRDNDGRQHRFTSVNELKEFMDLHSGRPLLVLSPLEHVRHLTNSQLIHTAVIEDNGDVAITVVQNQ